MSLVFLCIVCGEFGCFNKLTIFFQRDFSTECDLLVPLSISIILSFLEGHPVKVIQ